MEGRYIDKSPVSKSHSFGGYGGPNHHQLMRDDSISSSKSAGARLHKQDSTASTTWRLSPSSSGWVYYLRILHDYININLDIYLFSLNLSSDIRHNHYVRIRLHRRQLAMEAIRPNLLYNHLTRREESYGL